MKSSAAHGREDKKEYPAEKGAGASQNTETRPTDGEIFSHGGTPFQSDSTMERFFGLLSDRKPAPPVDSPTMSMDSPNKEKMPARPVKSSRFAGLFSPLPETRPRDPEPPASTASPVPNAAASDADQEGFQRILQMLGGNKSGNATPHDDHSQPPQAMLQTEQPRASLPSLVTGRMDRPDYVGLQEHSGARSAGPPMEENRLPENYDRDDPQGDRTQLLRLMQQVRIDPGRNTMSNQGQPQSAGPAPGMMNIPDAMPRPPGIPSVQKAASFLDDPAIANMQRPEARRPPMPGYFDEPPFPHNGQLPLTPAGSRAPHGLQRPPGFEHMPPPGFAGHQLPPQPGGGPGPVPPPPGIPARGVNPNFMMPMHGNMPPINERQPFPREVGNGSAFGPPPGMMPPPGYMNMNGPPPPGFPPMPEAFGGPRPGHGPFGPGPQAPPPPPSSRHLLEVFGQGGDGRGMPGPGQFR